MKETPKKVAKKTSKKAPKKVAKKAAKKAPKKAAKKAPQKSPAKAPIKDNINKHSFFEDVWDVARQIPKGRVTSYGAIAKYLGTGMSARMVGWAMNGISSATFKVPAHRVVNRNGMLSGKVHFNPPESMQQQLEKEKIKVVDDTIVDFDKHFWDPAIELGI